MTVFLIVVGIIAILLILFLSLAATLTVTYDNGWRSYIKILFVEKEIVLSKLLSFLLFPKENAESIKDDKKQKTNKHKKENRQKSAPASVENEIAPLSAKPAGDKAADQPTAQSVTEKKKKLHFIKKIWNEDGIVGMMSVVTNLIETTNSAVLTLFRGFHIHHLYVKIIIGGGDAAQIAESYGRLCSVYYPLKGIIANGMRIDSYEDYIQADFIAPETETKFQLIGSINVALLLKLVIVAAAVFLRNMIKNK